MRLIIKYFFLLTVVLFSFSCSKPGPYVKTVFEGEWEDISILTLLGGERYSFIFRADSFFMIKHVETDVHNRCFPNLLAWSEYYSGITKYDNDSIYLTGFRTDSINEKLEVSDCVKKVEYNISYKYEFRNDTLVFLPKEWTRDAAERLSPVDIKKHENVIAIYLRRKLNN